MKKSVRKVFAAFMAAAMIPAAVCNAEGMSAAQLDIYHDFVGASVSSFVKRDTDDGLGKFVKGGGIGYATVGSGQQGRVIEVVNDKLHLYGGATPEGNTTANNKVYLSVYAPYIESYSDTTGNTKLVTSVTYAANAAGTNNTDGMAIYGTDGETTYTPIAKCGLSRNNQNNTKPVIRMGDGTGTSGTDYVSVNLTKDKEYRVDMVTDLKAKTVDFYLDGEWKIQKNLNDTVKSVEGFHIKLWREDEYTINEIKAYIVDSNSAFEAVSGKNTDLYLSESFDLSFEGFIDETTLSGITVSTGGELISSDNYTLTSEVNTADNAVSTEVSIKMNTNLEYDTEYTVSVPATVKDEIARTAVAKDYIYKTEAGPSFNIVLTASADSIADAVGKYIQCKADVTNTTGGDAPKATTGTVFIGLFDSQNNCLAYTSAGREYAASESDTTEVSFSIPKDTTGLSVKAFVCTDIFNINNKYSDVKEIN